MGGDDITDWSMVMMVVSIHAPVWGATSAGKQGDGAISFNPRPRMGGDQAPLPLTLAGNFCFNPRPRMGGDPR